MAGVSIDVGADTRDFVRATGRDMPAALEKVVDALQDVERSGERSGDQIESAMKGAQRETDRQTDALRELVKQNKKVDESSDDIGRGAQRGFGKARESVGEFKQEALANFSEVTSSFDGSMSSVLDLAQGTFGGLGSLGGPIGLAAGGAAAILGGVFTGMTASADENAKKAEERIASMYDDFLESGTNYRTKDQVAEAIKDIVSDTDKWTVAQQQAKSAGIDVSLILQAQAGDAGALASVQATLAEKYAAARDEADKYLVQKGPQAGAANAEKNALAGLVSEYGNYSGQAQTAADKANAVRKAMEDLGVQTDTAAGKVDAAGGALDRIPTAKTVTLTVDDAAARSKIEALARNPLSIMVTARTPSGERIF